MKTRLDIPIESTWTKITYHPLPIITQLEHEDSADGWRKTIPNCTIEVFDDHRKEPFAGHLTRGITVKVIYPEDHTETYAEPLARIHKEYWNVVSNVIYDKYQALGTKNKFSMRMLGIRSLVHSLLARVYWDVIGPLYESYTPIEWAEQLNVFLDLVDKIKIRTTQWDEDLRRLEQEIIESCKHRAADKVDWSRSLVGRELK
jgi:hypothetical protein